MRLLLLNFIIGLLLASIGSTQSYSTSNEKPPAFPREFRGVWVACVYNIDWPSKPGLPEAIQKTELCNIIAKADEYKLNAIIFQVRPNADAVYRSSYEPYSHWISGTMGKSPGYDPLDYCIKEAHKKGIEVHAWFNPFRALPNTILSTSSDHITKTHPSQIRSFRNYKWMDPSSNFARQRALNVMLDVTRRYDIDGIHIDDYFYPYPLMNSDGTPKQIFPDGKTPAQRRFFVDSFVKQMYQSIKQVKPHLRVGISPFGIWQPGTPRGIEASINAYDHLAADSRKWLVNGWCDYMSPQLYWRISPTKQSYSNLLTWWRDQSQKSASKRPVWPGIATDRVMSTTDPGRPASEILKQVNLSRSIGSNWAGHCHWSMKSLLQNRGNVTNSLRKGAYVAPALVPPMTWMQAQAPAPPTISAKLKGTYTNVKWGRAAGDSKYAIQARYGAKWHSVEVTYGNAVNLSGKPEAIAVYSVDRYGNTSNPAVISLK